MPSNVKPKWNGVKENKILETKPKAKHRHIKAALTPMITPQNTGTIMKTVKKIIATRGPVLTELFSEDRLDCS